MIHLYTKGDPEVENSSVIGETLEFNYAICINKKQTLCWACPEKEEHDIAQYAFKEDKWIKGRKISK